jgi:hypothetical protein
MVETFHPEICGPGVVAVTVNTNLLVAGPDLSINFRSIYRWLRCP